MQNKLEKSTKRLNDKFYLNHKDSLGKNNFLKKSSDIWANSSILMSKICLAYDIKYFHFLQPNQYLENSKFFNKYEQANVVLKDSPYGDVAREGYPMLIKKTDLLKSEGVNFYDLTNIFKNESNTVYSDSCCHLNQLGNEYLLKAVLNQLISYLKPQKK